MRDTVQTVHKMCWQKLRLVHKQTDNAGHIRKIAVAGGWDEHIGFRFEAGPCLNDVAAKAVVDFRFKQQNPLALLPVVVRDSKKIERFGAADRAVPKIKFSHCTESNHLQSDVLHGNGHIGLLHHGTQFLNAAPT